MNKNSIGITANMVDLHIHTTLSDGKYEKRKILEYVEQNEYSTIALTDHDVLNRMDDMECFKNICTIGGVELSTNYKNGTHILGYGMTDLKAMEQRLKKIASSYVKCMLQFLKIIEKEKGIKLENIDIRKVTRHDLASILVERKICSDSEIAYSTLLSYERNEVKKPCIMTFPEAIDCIHRANGIAILAHPFRNNNIFFNDLSDMIEKGIDGIECFHPSHTKQQIVQSIEFCKKNNLLISGGSDFHSGDLNSIGKIGNYRLDESSLTIVKEIKNRFM